MPKQKKKLDFVPLHPDDWDRFQREHATPSQLSGVSPVTGLSLQETARRLEMSTPFPPSYTRLMSVVGPIKEPHSEVPRLLQLSEVQKFSETEYGKMIIDCYCSEGEWVDQEREGFTMRHLESCLLISSTDGDSCLLLNPEKVDKAGEWQAVFFANWVPGAMPFPSFGAMMKFCHNEGEE
uniref:Knr4/Smi1-like domain-containing protein n=1 Tax=Chromera velia CCMP2878 TaxID=1169474 RepID=A0A0G4IC48_9ALVE|eukprot:Cvel_13044.t1-p1 / transcript=Cvel_13044.t1 / gene=Cvel_13044 / organism=Chromera_velia_CCMP2878 / gene_product=hypothetical protein / transcript_product=hypothetical protein / location=Cvel_scaffold876:36650-37186(-) / protein_length=179 / sequence_SO=supercontig / SO=protein_coding / is_pseudo=false